jgi:hypothetical protein
MLPLREGIPERQVRDYERHGVTNLYAALNVISGKLIVSCADRHRQQEYIEFLALVDSNTAKRKLLQLIVHNPSAHDTKRVQEYVKERDTRSSFTSYPHTRPGRTWSNGGLLRLSRGASGLAVGAV